MASPTKAIGMAGSGAAAGSAFGPVGTGVGAGVGLLMGLFSDDSDMGQSAKLEEAANAIRSLDIPDIDKAIALQQFQQTGTFSPKLMEKIQLEADKKTTLIEDPENRARQEMAVNALKELSQTGMSAIDRAQMAEMRSQVAQDVEAKNAQIAQEAQMRGQSGGGQELAQKLLSTQGGAQQASKDAMRQATAAEQARRDALNQFLSGSERLRAADFGTRQFNVANELERQRFLDKNSLSRLEANTDIVNRANLLNLQRQQAISDMNIQAANKELARQREAQLNKYYAQLNKAKELGNVYKQQSTLAGEQAKAEAAGVQGMFRGIGQIGAAGKDFGWWGGPAKLTEDEKDINWMGDVKTSDAYKDIKNNWDSNAYEVLPAKNTYPGVVYSAHGGRIPGKSNVNGDSYKNDTVPAMLSPDEIVVPRSKAKDPKKAKSFIDEIFEQERLDKKQKKGYDRNESILDLIAKLHSEKSK